MVTYPYFRGNRNPIRMIKVIKKKEESSMEYRTINNGAKMINSVKIH